MLKKLAITAAVGTAVVGAGGAALAVPGNSGIAPVLSSTATSATSSSERTPGPSSGRTPGIGTRNDPNGAGNRAAGAQRRGVRLTGRLNRLAHATWVTRKGQSEDFVTHVAVHGDVTAVSATSISVKAADGVVQTYVVGAQTKVRVRASGAGTGKVIPAEATIASVRPGAHVIVVGTGTGTPTANRVVAGLRR